MKKIFVVLFVGLLFLSGCTKKNEITFLTLDEYVEKIETDEKFMVVIGNIDCSACQMYKPVLEEISKNKGLEIFYVQVDNSKWSTKDQSRLLEATKEAFSFDVTGTPTTLLVDNKELFKAVVGYKEYSEILSELEDFGLVSK